MHFLFFDPNMNQIEVPEGVWPQELFVSSIEKERETETIKGIPGQIDYGFEHGTREVSMTFVTKHKHGDYDYYLLISELNQFFDQYSYLYVAHKSLPTRVLPITVDSTFEPDRISLSKYATLDIDAEVSGLPYWRTSFTTKDIENLSFDANSEKFGLGDGIHQDHMRYAFETDTFELWNGGNVAINPRFMDMKITVHRASSTRDATITNKTTDETFIFKEALNDDDLILENGKVNIGVYNKLRDSNRKIITLAPGINQFEIKHMDFESIAFEFPYYYK